MSTGSEQSRQEIYGQLITLEDDLLLLPAVAVSEVSQLEQIDLNIGSPAWLVGFRDSRGQRQPIVALEALCGRAVPPRSTRARLVVVRSVADGPGWAFIGQGQPHLATLSPAAMQPEDLHETDDQALVIARARIANLSAMIPDLAAMEVRISEAAAKASATAAAAEPWSFDPDQPADQGDQGD